MIVHRIYSWLIDSLKSKTCHIERSEISQNKSANLQNPLDSSVGYRLPQNDKGMDCHDFATSAKSRNDKTRAKFHNNTKSRFIAFTQSKIYKILCWFITFNFINIAWIFFRAENVSGAVNLLKGMFGIHATQIPHKWSKIFDSIHAQTNEMIIWLVCAFVVCLVCRNSFEILKNYDKFTAIKSAFTTIAIIICLATLLFANRKIEFLYFNF